MRGAPEDQRYKELMRDTQDLIGKAAESMGLNYSFEQAAIASLIPMKEIKAAMERLDSVYSDWYEAERDAHEGCAYEGDEPGGELTPEQVEAYKEKAKEATAALQIAVYEAAHEARRLAAEEARKAVDSRRYRAEIVNLTPHAVTVNTKDGPVTYRGSHHPARMTVVEDGPAITLSDGVEVAAVKYGEPVGLPSPTPGRLLIVSAIMRESMPDRMDLVSPGELERDAEGKVTGCQGLEGSFWAARWLGG